MLRQISVLLGAVAFGLLLIAPASAAVASPARLGTAPEDGLLHLAAAQAVSSGSGVTVAVLDTGTNASLPVFAGRVTSGPSYVTGARVAGDEDHGTGMSYLVLHVAPDVHILAVRVTHGILAINGKNTVSCPVCAGIKYAIAHGADVISMSLGSITGGIDGYDEAMAAAVEEALADGITVVAAAGNNGAPAVTGVFGTGVTSTGEDDASFPGAYTGVISVAAVSRSGLRAFFSTVHSYIDVAAPGVNIPMVAEDGEQVLEGGTSQATALTSGVVALILSKVHGLAPWQVLRALETTASHPHSWNQKTGYGVINAAAALRAAEAMTPASPVQAVVPYTGPSYFGSGPAAATGSSGGGLGITGHDVHVMLLVLLALVSFGGVFLLAWRERRSRSVPRQAAAPAGLPGQAQPLWQPPQQWQESAPQSQGAPQWQGAPQSQQGPPWPPPPVP
jgi:subtilisin family serine protease